MLKKVKRSFERFWYFLWKDDSWFGWIFSMVFLFIFIKFIFFPLLSLISGSALPLAIVESCSMFHNEGISINSDSWFDGREEYYEDFFIDSEDFSNFNLKNGFNKGDVLLIIGANPKKLKVGEIIVFQAPTKNPVIHRIVEIKEKDGKRLFSTIGDNNNGQIYFEKEISEEQIIGKALLKVVPYIGWVKLVFYEYLREPSQRGFCDKS